MDASWSDLQHHHSGRLLPSGASTPSGPPAFPAKPRPKLTMPPDQTRAVGWRVLHLPMQQIQAGRRHSSASRNTSSGVHRPGARAAIDDLASGEDIEMVMRCAHPLEHVMNMLVEMVRHMRLLRRLRSVRIRRNKHVLLQVCGVRIAQNHVCEGGFFDLLHCLLVELVFKPKPIAVSQRCELVSNDASKRLPEFTTIDVF